MEIQIFADADSVAKEAAKLIAAEARSAVSVRGRFMIAVSGGNYFLGLFSPQGRAYQYVAAGSEQLSTRITFTIEGERTEIESRYVVDAWAAAAAVREWLAAGREAASSGHWLKM